MPPLERIDQLVFARKAAPTSTMAARAIAVLDLTSMRGDEDAADAAELCRRGQAAGVAAVCVRSACVAAARELLTGSAIRVATVANYPDGGDDIARAADEVAAAVADGADEVDVVAPIGALHDGDIGLVGDLVEACRSCARPDTALKLVLQTGLLERPELIVAAARAAVMSGADFLAASTGSAADAATPEAAAILLSVIAEAGGRVGLKVSGIGAPGDVAVYLALADAVMGEGWSSPDRLRIGGSSLLDELLQLSAEGN